MSLKSLKYNICLTLKKNEKSETNIANIICPSVTDPVKPYPGAQFILSGDNLSFLIPGEEFVSTCIIFAPPRPLSIIIGFYKISVFRYSYLMFKRSKNIKHNYH